MVFRKALALSAVVVLRGTAGALESGYPQHRRLQDGNSCFDRQDDLSCVPGVGDTIELEGCGITDDDLMDLAECFDQRGRASITNLNINFNEFTYIPDELFKGFSNLKQLSILATEISTLPEGIFNDLPLDYLVLSGNKISFLPGDVFSGLGGTLQTLLLGGNMLVTVPEELFRGLGMLENLSLAENALTNLPALVFDGLDELQILQLHRNALTTLPAGLFDSLGKLTRLTLGDNEDLLCLPDLTGSPLLTAEQLELPSADFDPTALCACPLEGEEGYCEDCEQGVDGFVCSGQTCDNGLPGVSQGDVCCEASCGTCGGSGCSGRGNGQDSCCTKNITANGETCSVKGAAPCIMDGDVVVPPTPAPVLEPTTGFSCSGDAGILKGDICCEASCGTCGGSGCSGRGNGQDSCCTKNIAANGETCSMKGTAPCIMDGEVVDGPTPAPVTEPTTGFSCSGDAGILKGDICCEASCGTCGGSGCSGRGNGQDSCCTKNIAANGETCSVKGAAPCIVDDDTVTHSYQEVGCYTDMADPDRIMGDLKVDSKSMTIETCQAHCAESAYFGVQYAIECWCSGTGSADYPYNVHGASTDCNKPCSGNAAETCGGDWAVNVYRNA
eukprot:g7592.t2